jgi:hypothetical protein
MPLIKLQSEGLNLADNFAFTGSISGAGGGKILQVIQGTLSSEASTSSSTFADCGLSASITPASSSNKILVLVNLNAVQRRDNLTRLEAKLLRGSTDIVLFGGRAGYQQKYGYGSNDHHTGVGSASCNHLDSPSTTSATTYKVQFKSQGNNASVRVSSDNEPSQIILMEVQA